MEKKVYLTPEMTEVEIETVNIIAASDTEASSGDYNVGGWDEDEGGEI